ncbi:probable maleylacetoacetate isomerase 2 [Schistocerca gregaria]|uniref:probable maleylacetoacetate isomerase 2 n=1 Tax=Schistocerca gregaria TaxID=7010 RepID=UPI00211DC7C5|nr:probable maleylacetoacetate isomerase 2 [Schistocerca gregaria]
MVNDKLILYSYWRSSAAWRLRIALYWKSLDFEYRPVKLAENGQQRGAEFAKVNPMMQVPTLVVNDRILAESLPIIEYLEEAYPHNPLLPKCLFLRAKVREIANIVAADIHPIQNLDVVVKLKNDYGTDRNTWAKYWIERRFGALEKILSNGVSGRYAVGDQITLADVFLVPQAFAGVQYGVDLSKFPTIERVAREASKEEAFVKAHPTNQPDADPEEVSKWKN